MRSRLVTVRNTLTRVAAVVAATAAVSLLLPAVPASAHGQLATSTPLTGTVVREPLTQVGLYFTEKPAANAHFTITGPNGSRVDNGWSFGEPKRLDKPVQEYFMVNGVFEPRLYHTGFPAMVSVAHWPAKGRYTATYLSVASDGEAVRGNVTFDYQGPGTAAPAGWTAPTNEPEPALLALAEGTHSASAAPATTGAPVAGPAAPPRDRGLPPWVLPAAIVVVVGAIIVLASRRKPAPGRPTDAARRPTGAARQSGGTTRRRGGTSRKPARRGRR
ncbi:copper resistance protein CopC [Micromonospora sp. STR1_7]|uniref:Copper resistance protein CopC n=1 Tax=Micromonospora parastrephiae TaxID=2806101 RepID=A0ABS1XQ65_9ACTN|nr:copper resistance protein CopC [Micromonospora parastrephiae]MBM0231339.1 copper resistance protein CopC [Micromonospora parastrephiae]